MSFKDFLKNARKGKKISLDKLEELSGVSRSTISSYECGIQPTIEKADKILRALDVTYVLGKGEANESSIY